MSSTTTRLRRDAVSKVTGRAQYVGDIASDSSVLHLALVLASRAPSRAARVAVAHRDPLFVGVMTTTTLRGFR